MHRIAIGVIRRLEKRRLIAIYIQKKNRIWIFLSNMYFCTNCIKKTIIYYRYSNLVISTFIYYIFEFNQKNGIEHQFGLH